MSLIQRIKDYLAEYEGLKEDAPLWVNFLGNTPTEYAIVPLPGSRIIETYLNDSSVREYPFAFQSMELTADELERLENLAFHEALATWFETQTKAGDLPTLDSGMTAETIEAVGWGYLYQQGESKTGIYQVTCRLTYKQNAP